MTEDTIAVVKPHYVTEVAYVMGYNRFEDADEPPDDEPVDLSYFKESATWSNTVAPRLRAAAGYADRGHGTYTTERRVAAIRPGCEEDEPADADLLDAQTVFEALVDAFDRGAYDAVEGRGKDAPDWAEVA